MILSAIDDYIFRRCIQDFEFYCEYSLSLSSTDHTSKPFLLFDYQKYVSKIINKKDKVVIVTPRQMGFTTLMAARCFWQMQVQQQQEILVVVPRAHHVKHFMSIINFWIQKGQYFNLHSMTGKWQTKTGEIVCMGNGSRLRCVPAETARVKGMSINTLIMLDYAFHRKTNISHSNLTAFLPCVTPGGKVIVVSTPGMRFANDQAEDFKKLYQDAVKGKNGFYPYRIPWWARPGNSIELFAEIVDAFGIKQYNHEILASFE